MGLPPHWLSEEELELLDELSLPPWAYAMAAGPGEKITREKTNIEEAVERAANKTRLSLN